MLILLLHHLVTNRRVAVAVVVVAAAALPLSTMKHRNYIHLIYMGIVKIVILWRIA
jgi:hypothetical protein